jgi:hypothetical protein
MKSFTAGWKRCGKGVLEHVDVKTNEIIATSENSRSAVRLT